SSFAIGHRHGNSQTLNLSLNLSWRENALLQAKFLLSAGRQLRRILRQQVFFEDETYDQKRRRQEGAHRSPQPGPECERQEYRKRVQRKPPADDGRCDEMTFQEGYSRI